MKTRILLLLPFLLATPVHAQFLADIQEPVETDFGTYTPYAVDVTPSIAPYDVALDLSDVANIEDFTFTDSQLALMVANHFAVIPERADLYTGLRQSPEMTGYRELYDIYGEACEMSIPQFVTTDAVLHTFHKLYDRALMSAEEEYFIGFLESMDQTLFQRAYDMYEAESDPFAKNVYRVLAAYFAVPMSILDDDFIVPEPLASVVEDELDLIEAHGGYALSPLFAAYNEDYSQYKPRGHYTKTDELGRYFKAMMWHGRQTFTLYNAGYVSSEPRPDLAGAALLLVHMMQNDPTLGKLWTHWNNIYIPTVFFVGKADDLLPRDFIDFAELYFDADIGTLSTDQFLDETTLLDFIDQADDYFPDPEITTNTPKGMRFMGQRFIPDSYFLDQLVFPFVPLRMMPKSLDVLAVMHSGEAYNLLDQMDETDYENYIEQLTDLKTLAAEYPDEQWAENLYWNWLYCLMPLLVEHGEGYPPYMQNLAWLRKDINTALGSWAELRHDTILYAKQSTTEYTSVPPVNDLVKGYVEPNPWVFARLASLSKLMREGLGGLGILTGDMGARLTALEGLLVDLKTIAEKELNGETITDYEYYTIANFGNVIGELIDFTEGMEFGWGWEGPDLASHDEMPVVADVHTDSNSNNCLEEGVGYPFRIAVICPVEGVPTICVGGVFSYYEFEQPIANRLTDEEWVVMLTSETPPQLP
ncbi:MAG: DUF3160 domain-containing protein, partial [bacterium]